MGLKITKASDPIRVEQIVVNIYGAPGLGKTSLSFTADRPLLLDFDGGAHRSANRGDAVRVESWQEIAKLSPEDLKDYRTVVVDTVGRGLDHLTALLIEDDPKLARRDGSLSLQGFGALKASFASWLTRVKQSGLDVVLVSHMDEQRKGDDVIERLDIQGSSKNEIYKSADAMARLYMANGKRVLNFSPTDVGFGKNPAGFAPLAVPDFGNSPHFLAEIIGQIKAKLNAESDEQGKERIRIQEAREAFEKLGTADEFTAETERLKGADAKVKRLLIEVAGEKGFAIPKGSKKFEAKEAKQAEIAA